MTDSRQSDSSIVLKLEPPGHIHNGTTGWRVKVLIDSRFVGTTVENTSYEAAVIGVGLAHRALAALKAE